MSDSDAHKRKGEAQVEQWEAELKKLKAEAKEASADGQIKLEKKMDELRGKIEKARN
ncbi:hypothetical protein [Aliidiomarina soli]|uniref:hypothetical protein n=1 Tax=Aliidiomarina soli TaxID=1928574 RepID=UPI001300AC7F|nr:hypothetical protein [Aliidiomarina soli]